MNTVYNSMQKKTYSDYQNYSTEQLTEMITSNKYSSRVVEIFEDILNERINNGSDPNQVSPENEVSHSTKSGSSYEFCDEEIEKGIHISPIWKTLIFLSFPFLGIIPIIAGSVFLFSKRTNSKNVQYYTYDKSTRKAGIVMLIPITLIIILVLWQIIKKSF